VFRCQERQTQSHILNTDPPAAENLTLKKRNKNRIKVKRSILIEKTERSFRLVEHRAYSSESDTTIRHSSFVNSGEHVAEFTIADA
jgi:hypothetical protein